MTIDPNFALITGAPAGKATFFYLATVGSDPADVFTFGYSPAVGWDHDTSTAMSFIDGVDNGGFAGNRRFWPFGVGDGTVVVAWNAGSSSPTVAVLTVTVIGPPTAHLTVTPSTGTAPLDVGCNASASTSPVAGVGLTAGWDLGDGTILSPGALVRGHIYNPPLTSTFTVIVTVYDDFGQSDTASATVHVTVVPKILPPLRQYPRDDALGGAPRQGHANGATSIQSSARQGWRNTYR